MGVLKAVLLLPLKVLRKNILKLSVGGVSPLLDLTEGLEGELTLLGDGGAIDGLD